MTNIFAQDLRQPQSSIRELRRISSNLVSGVEENFQRHRWFRLQTSLALFGCRGETKECRYILLGCLGLTPDFNVLFGTSGA